MIVTCVRLKDPIYGQLFAETQQTNGVYRGKTLSRGRPLSTGHVLSMHIYVNIAMTYVEIIRIHDFM